MRDWRRSRNLGFGMRANARPARRAGPIVRLPQFCSSSADEGGPSTGGQSPDGLLHSVAGQTDRGRRPLPPTPEGPIKGGSRDPSRELSPVSRNHAGAVRSGARRCMRNSTPETGQGSKSASARAGTLHPAAFGRCPRPAGTTTRPETPGVKLIPPRPPLPANRDSPRVAGGLRGLQLDPGSGRMVPVTRVGRSPSAQRHPPGEGAAASADQRCEEPLLASGRVGLLAEPA
jgi:hypothetical protein